MTHIVIKCGQSCTKSPSLVLTRLVLTAIKPFENVKIYKEMYGHPDVAVSDSVRMAIHFFVNFDIFRSLYLRYQILHHTG